MFRIYITVISQEKQEVEFRDSIQSHNRDSLKKVDVHEKDAFKERKFIVHIAPLCFEICTCKLTFNKKSKKCIDLCMGESL